MRRVQLVAAQLGRKTGKDDVLARMLGASDLPDGPWKVIDQRTWRTGVVGSATGWGQRARQAGSITGWRSFSHQATPRAAWVQVVPLASADDASAAVTVTGERALANLRSKVQLISERAMPLEPFPGASTVWAREQDIHGKDGPGIVLTLAGAVSHWVVILCLSGTPAWDWSSASELAALQAVRLPD